MLRKNLLLFFLIISLLLPLFSSIMTVAGFYSENKKSCLVDMMEKEESPKGEEDSFEKEKDKDFILVSYDFLNSPLLLEVESQFVSDAKAISGTSDLHLPPPKNS